MTPLGTCVFVVLFALLLVVWGWDEPRQGFRRLFPRADDRPLLDLMKERK